MVLSRKYNIYMIVRREKPAGRRPRAQPGQTSKEKKVRHSYYCGCERGRLDIRLIENRGE